MWQLQPESSFNTDGRYPAYDMMKVRGTAALAQSSGANCTGTTEIDEITAPSSPTGAQPYGGLDVSQAWLAPQPGGSVYWSLGACV